MKAIETVYNGYRFRSRLEARWAVFFDTIGMEYIYEPQGYEFSDGTKYLPDFYLPESSAYFEVKGVMNDKDMHKIKQLIKESGRPCTIGYSDLTFESCNYWEGFEWAGQPEEGVSFSLSDKHESVLACCKKCGKYFFTGYLGSYACLCCGHYDGDRTFKWCAWGVNGDKYLADYDIVNEAYSNFKQARFEHGERIKRKREPIVDTSDTMKYVSAMKKFMENHPGISAIFRVKGNEFGGVEYCGMLDNVIYIGFKNFEPVIKKIITSQRDELEKLFSESFAKDMFVRFMEA